MQSEPTPANQQSLSALPRPIGRLTCMEGVRTFHQPSTLMNYTFQSFNFRERTKLRPFYDVISNIAAQEYSHIELVAHTINLLLTGTTTRGTDPTATPLASAVDARNSYHFIASGQTALPVDSMGVPWNGSYVFSSGNLKLDLLHNFFFECGARANKIRRESGLQHAGPRV
jgi:Mn-containing catalase